MITVISCYHENESAGAADFGSENRSIAAMCEGERLVIGVTTKLVAVHPGETLLKEFLEPKQLTQRQLADGIQVPYQRINEIINGRRGITPSTALRLGKFFGVSASFWLTLQLRWELHRTQQTEVKELAAIEPLTETDDGGTNS
jgi:addiction module HigA family antidote